MATNLHMNMLDADDHTKKYSLPFMHVHGINQTKRAGILGAGDLEVCLAIRESSSSHHLVKTTCTSFHQSTWYLYMEDDRTGNVRGKEGDPGEQLHCSIIILLLIIVQGIMRLVLVIGLVCLSPQRLPAGSGGIAVSYIYHCRKELMSNY